MKRLLSLCLAVILSLAVCNRSFASAISPTTATKTGEPIPSSGPAGLTGDISGADLREVEVAFQLGLLPDTLEGDYNASISRQNMEAVAKNAVELYYGEPIQLDTSALAIPQDAPSITKLQAAVILTEATRAAWNEYPWPNGDPKKTLDQGGADNVCADDGEIWGASPSRPATIRLWGGNEWPLSVVSAIFATRQVDKITGSALIPLDMGRKFYPAKEMTNLAAIQAALRLHRSLDPKPRYVALADMPTHAIAEELYTGTSALPQASNRKLPAWHGTLYFPKCWFIPEAFGSFNDHIYRESDFIAMRGAGMNFVAIYISPVRLGWPYGGDDLSSINLVELELLDQAIAWAFENGLHVQLSFNGSLGVPFTDNAACFDSSQMFQDQSKADLLTEYWRMLARRYADIPNQYLGFTLMNEVDPPSDEEYIRVFGPAIDAIWEECPDRLIIADIHSGNISGKSMAKKGVALSRHQYALPLFDYNLTGNDGMGLMDLYPGYEQDLTWPQLYLPSLLHGKKNRMTFKGSFAAGELMIGVNQIADGNEVLCVRIDGKEKLAEAVTTTGERNVWNMLTVNKEYAVAIPEGAKKIELYNKCNNGIIVYNRLKFTQKGMDDLILFPHDTFNMSWKPESATIKIGANFSLEGNRFITWRDLKTMGGKLSYDSIKAMAQKYKVGFLVGEFGPFGENGLPPAVFEGYLTMMMEGMNADQVGWAHAAWAGTTHLLHVCPAACPDVEFEPLEDSPYQINVMVRDLLKKYATDQ